jgi:hypothetical protein
LVIKICCLFHYYFPSLRPFYSHQVEIVLKDQCKTEASAQVARETLPGSAPILDHLHAWLLAAPDWSEVTPTLEKLRHQRLPSLDDLSTVREITIGESSPAAISDAIFWIREKISEAVPPTHFFVLPAVCVKRVPVRVSPPPEAGRRATKAEWLDLLEVLEEEKTAHSLQVSAADPEPEFLNVYGAQESIPRNEFRQPMQPGGPVR